MPQLVGVGYLIHWPCGCLSNCEPHHAGGNLGALASCGCRCLREVSWPGAHASERPFLGYSRGSLLCDGAGVQELKSSARGIATC